MRADLGVHRLDTEIETGGQVLRVRRVERLEHEYLDGEIGVDVIVAHESDDLPSSQLLDLATDIGFHYSLPPPAQVQYGLALAGVGERPLAAREAVLEDNEHAVLA